MMVVHDNRYQPILSTTAIKEKYKIVLKRYATAAVHRNIILKLINNTVLSSKKSSKLSSQRLISYQDLDPK